MVSDFWNEARDGVKCHRLELKGKEVLGTWERGWEGIIRISVRPGCVLWMVIVADILAKMSFLKRRTGQVRMTKDECGKFAPDLGLVTFIKSLEILLSLLTTVIGEKEVVFGREAKWMVWPQY